MTGCKRKDAHLKRTCGTNVEQPHSLANSAERKRRTPRPAIVRPEGKTQDHEALCKVRSANVAYGSTKNTPFRQKRHARSSCQTDLQHIRDGRMERPA